MSASGHMPKLAHTQPRRLAARTVADRIAMLYAGKIVQIGTPDEIRNSDDVVVRQFVEGRIEGPIE